MTDETNDHPDRLMRELLYGSLTDQEKEFLHIHLEECSRCRELLDELQATKKVLEESKPERSSQGEIQALEDRLIAALPDQSGPGEGIKSRSHGDIRGHGRWGASVAAAVLLLVGGVILARYSAPIFQGNGQGPDNQITSTAPDSSGQMGAPPDTTNARDTTVSKGTIVAGDSASPLERSPTVIGGSASIQEQLIYPEEARTNRVEGVVVVEFTVTEAGEVADPEVVPNTSLGYGCDRAAIRAIEEVRFQPALREGSPTAVRMSIPVRFELQERTEAL